MSLPPYASLNVGVDVGDNPGHVRENLKRIADFLDLRALYQGDLMHGTTVHTVAAGSPLFFPSCDGLVTRERGVGLLMTHADCQVALFYDPGEGIIGAAHAGWRGNVQRMYTKMVQRFVELGSHPREILVAISPSLGPDHAEFKDYKTHFPPSFWPFQVSPCHFDLWAIAKRELLDAGIVENHIEIAQVCTYCHGGDYFSYRREHLTGRNGTVIALKS